MPRINDLFPSFKVNWLWLLISCFLVAWLGTHLWEAISSLQVPNLRTTNLVSFEKSPLWFTFVLLFKFAAWLIALVYVIFIGYIFTKEQVMHNRVAGGL